MKTVEEWIREYQEERRLYLDGKITDHHRKLKWLNGDLLKQVQLDAFKAGMTEAARIVSDTYETPVKGEKVGPIANLILRVRDVKASL